MQTLIGRRRQSFSVMSAASRLAGVSFGVASLLAIAGVYAQTAAPTCDQADKEVPLSVSAAGQSVSFSCGSGFTTLKPTYTASSRADGPKVCSDAECKNEGYLKALVQEATFVAGNSNNYTLTVTALPKTEQVFYFLCSQDASGSAGAGLGGAAARRLSDNSSKSCRVKVTVQASSGNSATTATVARACLSVGVLIVGLVSYF